MAKAVKKKNKKMLLKLEKMKLKMNARKNHDFMFFVSKDKWKK